GQDGPGASAGSTSAYAAVASAGGPSPATAALVGPASEVAVAVAVAALVGPASEAAVAVAALVGPASEATVAVAALVGPATRAALAASGASWARASIAPKAPTRVRTPSASTPRTRPRRRPCAENACTVATIVGPRSRRKSTRAGSDRWPDLPVRIGRRPTRRSEI